MSKKFFDGNKSQLEVLKQAIVTSKISRIIAKEAVSIEFSDKAETASFDLESRVLTIPYNTNMSDEDIRDMFIFHEVSHAIFTPLRLVIKSNYDLVHREFNITEDIRCERLIKERYPALHKTFFSGYQKLLNRGFFGKDVSKMNFSSRLNVYAKVGITIASTVNFSQSEQEFYYRCYNAKTAEEAYELALELKKIGKRINEESFSTDDVFSKLDDEYDEDGNLREYSQEELAQMLADYMKEMEHFQSYDNFYEQFNKGNINNCKIETFVSAKISKFIPYNFLIDYSSHIHQDVMKARETEIRENREDMRKSVDYMARQFESKKAAFRSKNAKISETGFLNSSRLFAYKISDDIFKNKTNLADAKNHGAVIMLDCSGSIANSWKNMVNQVILLTEYFRMVRIPYQVFTFGHSLKFSYKDQFFPENLFSSISTTHNITVPLEFLNSNQSLNLHNKMCNILLHRTGFDLGGTPTLSSLTYIEKHMVEFFEKRNIQKRKLIVITDGDPTDVQVEYAVESVSCFDPLTKKSYNRPSIRYGNQFIKVFSYGAILKDRYNIDMICMGLTSTLEKFHSNFFGSSCTEDERKQFNRELYLCKSDPYFETKVFFIKPKEVEVDVDGMEISPEKSAKQNSRALIKTMKGLGKSRVLLNALSEIFAI